VLGEGDFSYGFGVLDFSHEEVKRVWLLFIGFFLSIASAACVMGALWRKTDRKIATAPKTQSRCKDQSEIKIIQSRIK